MRAAKTEINPQVHTSGMYSHLFCSDLIYNFNVFKVISRHKRSEKKRKLYYIIYYLNVIKVSFLQYRSKECHILKQKIF